jgi:hypothetical protein
MAKVKIDVRILDVQMCKFQMCGWGIIINTSLQRRSLTQPSPKERALKCVFKVSPFGGDLEGAITLIIPHCIPDSIGPGGFFFLSTGGL